VLKFDIVVHHLIHRSREIVILHFWSNQRGTTAPNLDIEIAVTQPWIV